MATEGSSSPAKAKKSNTKRVISDSEGDNDRSSVGGSAKKKKIAKRVAPPADDEDELESEEDNEDTPAGRQRLKAKAKGKSRATANGNDHPNGDGEEDDDAMGDGDAEGEGDLDEPVGVMPEYQRGDDGFVAGSVVRLKLINFMTYDHVEFRPGPHLNMILGPNGTGKSAISAGILLGLGGKAKLMAKMDHLREYVKQGTEEAQTEVEIKGFPGKRNPIIHRKWTFGSNKSEYKLNHEPTTEKAVKALVAKYGIHADNLCCFLPQDRVSQFAAMSADQVLTATMQSAGDPRLCTWHDSLKTLGVEERKLEGSLGVVETERDKVQNQVNSLEADVRNHQERASLEKEVKVLKCLKIAARRCQVLQGISLAKSTRMTLRKELAKRLSRGKPIQELQDHYKKKLEEAKKRCDKAHQMVGTIDKEMRDSWRQIDRKEDAVEKIEMQLNKIKSDIKREEKTRAEINKKKNAAQEILDKPVEHVQAQIQEYTEARTQVSNKCTAAKRESEEIAKKHNDLQAQSSDWTRVLEVKSSQLQRLSSVVGQKEDMARTADGTLNYVLQWLADHESEFEGKVYKPPLISVNLKDKRFADQVESGTTWGQRCTFIVQNKNDYNRMLALNRHTFGPWQQRDQRNGRLMNKPGGPVRLHLAQVQVDERSLNPQKACSPEVLRDLGFAGWASEFIEAEPAVIAFLNEKCGLSRLAVTLKHGSQIDADAAQRAGIQKWVSANDITNVGRSRYGKKDIFMNVSTIQQAQSFNVVVDHVGVAKLQEEITKLKRDKRDIADPIDELRVAQDEARERLRVLQEEQVCYSDKLQELRQLNAARMAAGVNLQRANDDLRKLGTPESHEARRAALSAQLTTNFEDRVAMISQAIEDQEKLLPLAASLTKRRLEQIQLSADLKAIEDKKAETITDISDLETQIEKCSADLALGKKNNHILDQDFKTYLAAMGDDTAAITERLHEVEPPADDPAGVPVLTEDKIKEAIQGLNVQLSLSVGVDQDTVDRYHRLVAQLGVLKQNAETQSTDHEKVRKSIDKILRVFKPSLDELIKVVDKEFSKSFRLVGCTGEVQLNDAPGDYGAWGIRILVSYRDIEKLAVLTKHVQSGGERALATATYLMSLSSVSRSPFTLVDEINQGMDPRVERGVHNQLVQVTCATGAGQYFLITPKLLTDLEYHPKMKILNVNNGRWLPAPAEPGSQEKWADFKGCIERYRTAKGMPEYEA